MQRVTADELDAELARKLDVTTYLSAAGASSHAAAAVGALAAMLDPADPGARKLGGS
jgi:hypothetical protein